MSSARSSARLPNISLLDTGLFAGLVFLLLGGILLFGRTRESGEGTALGEVKLENLPGNSSSCWAPLDAQGNGGCVISLNERNELAFALREVGNNFHVRVINQLAIQHGVVLNPSALAELKALPFLTCDIEKLPLLLNAPRWQRTQLIQSGKLGSLSPSQLSECVAIIKAYAPSNLHQQVFYYLRVHEDASAPAVHALTDLLQAQGINRYNLLTRSEE